MKLFKEAAYINGTWVNAHKKQTVINPATGKVIGSVPDLGAKGAKDAIKAAKEAFLSWKNLLATEREKYLNRWADLIEENAEELAQILTKEEGKPLFEARGEIAVGITYIRWNAEEGRRAYGETIPTGKKGQRPITIRQPIGVVAAITPWNFPNSMITRKVAPALAAGCTIIVKPSPETPFSALALAALAEKAGFPKGVFNVVTGDEVEIGEAFMQSETVRAIGFTGSTEVGKLLMKQGADTLKRVSLELGGNAPFIVYDDANVKEAAYHAMICKFRNAGQTCICANRILVQEGIYDAFLKEFKKQVKTLVPGNGLQKKTTLGPLIKKEAIERIKDLMADALSKGAKCVMGGKPLRGNFFEATILTNVKPSMRVFKEEIFGPIAPIVTFKTEKEAISLANSTDYGLAGYVFGSDMARLLRTSEALEFGMVGINETVLGISEAPFGGMKHSGQGREGGRYGIEEFTEVKYLLMGGL